ncbi:major facilitator superfamily transporter [Ceratobasidium sp. AG-Ba]|nr:major facilitator superfamily transporter [Ceratobasidium sp. AG-Ba]QRW02189.1 major facilitator superfamily transporter [Ceratobasidium sp. AG-Ba]
MLLKEQKWIQRVVVLALIIDLFAFTIPLPLFPRLIDWYTLRESDGSLLATTLKKISQLRGRVAPHAVQRKWDVVLLGGLMGSLFSSLQFFISPHIGSLSDKYGRKRVLLVSMLGNILSAIVWIQSTSFASFMLSRAIGGISEGNVQLSIAILSDITPPARRSAALMFVGIAFSICFTIGPPIGAYFSTHPAPFAFARDLNIYATPATLTLVLLLIETAFLAAFLPETRGTTLVDDDGEGARGKYKKLSLGERKLLLKDLGRLHFSFLSLFSGVEFTLTFLSFDLLDWNNTQNGRLLGLIGIFSALLQGGYVRRATAVVGEPAFVRRGMISCAGALIILSWMPHLIRGSGGKAGTQGDVRAAVGMLHAAAALLSFTSATVVSSLTALASLQCDEESNKAVVSTGSSDKPATGLSSSVQTGSSGSVRTRPSAPRAKVPQNTEAIPTGRTLGEFRSSGQLGRAIGPLLACFAYWTVGPSATYAATALAMCALVWRAGVVTSRLRRIS